MSKLEDAIALIMEDQGDTSNAEIAKRLGCDEGIIRRARKEAHGRKIANELAYAMCDIIDLKYYIAVLEIELARYRRATLPPKRDRGSARSYPLLGETP